MLWDSDDMRIVPVSKIQSRSRVQPTSTEANGSSLRQCSRIDAATRSQNLSDCPRPTALAVCSMMEVDSDISGALREWLMVSLRRVAQTLL